MSKIVQKIIQPCRFLLKAIYNASIPYDMAEKLINNAYLMLYYRWNGRSTFNKTENITNCRMKFLTDKDPDESVKTIITVSSILCVLQFSEVHPR